MRVLVVNTSSERSPDTVIPMGACLVASSAASSGHEVRFLDLTFSNSPAADAARAAISFRPEVIGFSIRNIDNCDMSSPRSYLPQVRDIVRACQEVIRCTTVIGGAAVTSMPDCLLDYVGADYAIAGEGETSFPAFLASLPASREVSEASVSVGLPRTEIDFSGWLDLKKYQRSGASIPVQTKRGCPFHCSYCLYPKIEGQGIRLRLPEEVAGDVQRAAKLGFRSVEFVDSVFNVPEDHAVTCCEEIAYRGNKIPLQTLELNPLCSSSELVRAMNAAGFCAVGCTAESASDEMLTSLEKGFDADSLHMAAQSFRQLKALRVWIFMLGGPGETEATVAETIRFMETELTPRDLVYISCGIRVYPGTDLHRRAIAEGVVTADDPLLWPSFYFSPHLTPERAMEMVFASRFPSGNIISLSDGNSRLLPSLQRIAQAFHIRPPYWRLAPQWNRISRALSRHSRPEASNC